MSDEPRPQPPVECHRYPGRDCPGECQYILGPNECANEIEERRRGLVAPKTTAPTRCSSPRR
jgi:hypothetical protein